MEKTPLLSFLSTQLPAFGYGSTSSSLIRYPITSIESGILSPISGAELRLNVVSFPFTLTEIVTSSIPSQMHWTPEGHLESETKSTKVIEISSVQWTKLSPKGNSKEGPKGKLLQGSSVWQLKIRVNKAKKKYFMKCGAN